MSRHQSSLGKAEGKKKQQHDLGGFSKVPYLAHILNEVHGQMAPIQPDITPAQGGQKEAKRGEEKVSQVGTPASTGFLVLHVSNQRKGGHREHLIKKVDGQQIGGKCDTHGGRQRESEEGIEAGLSMLVQPTHIPNCIEGGGNP